MQQVEPLARGELVLRVLARDPLLAAAELGLGAALVQLLDEGSQHRGGNIPAMPRFGAIIFDLLTALLDSWTLWGDVAGDEEVGAELAAEVARVDLRGRRVPAVRGDRRRGRPATRFAHELLDAVGRAGAVAGGAGVLRDLARDHGSRW